MDIQEKQALIAEIERFKEQALKMHIVQVLADTYERSSLFDYNIDYDGSVIWYKAQARQLWDFWKAAQAVPEGFVLVEKAKIKTWYQDDEEPENFCNDENGFDDLAGHIDSDYILQINKIEDCVISSTPKFGVWKTECVGQYGDIHRNFILADTREDAEKVIQSNRAIDKAWNEAQEPAND